MCGLTGFLSQSWKPENEDILRRMAQVINHRGPDAEGFYTSSDSGIALGHRRLSIMDVSSAGAQPMRSSCQRYVMVYRSKESRDQESVLSTQLTQAKKIVSGA